MSTLENYSSGFTTNRVRIAYYSCVAPRICGEKPHGTVNAIKLVNQEAIYEIFRIKDGSSVFTLLEICVVILSIICTPDPPIGHAMQTLPVQLHKQFEAGCPLSCWGDDKRVYPMQFPQATNFDLIKLRDAAKDVCLLSSDVE